MSKYSSNTKELHRNMPMKHKIDEKKDAILKQNQICMYEKMKIFKIVCINSSFKVTKKQNKTKNR